MKVGGARLVVALGDEDATARLGAKLARLSRPGDLVLLSGGLGAGKTALARALIQTLRPGEEVPSPTFTLAQTYEGGTGEGCEIVHYDLYRVESPDEVWELGWAESIGRLILVEWPERLHGLGLPDDRLEVSLEPGSAPGARVARLVGFGTWAERVRDLEM